MIFTTMINNDQALFASWEPRHSRHCYKYPWQQYVKLGSVLRHFGYTTVALYGCLESEIQVPYKKYYKTLLFFTVNYESSPEV